MNTIRTTPTGPEREVLDLNPSSSFGFFLKTEKPAATTLSDQGIIVSQQPFKLFDGYGMHIVGTPSELRQSLNTLARAGNPVTQHLLLEREGWITVYDRKNIGVTGLPLPKARALRAMND